MSSTMTQTTYLYGKNPLREALFAAKRGKALPIEKLFLTKFAQEDPSIMSLVQSNKIEYSTLTSQEIESMVGRDVVHQGVLATLNEKALYTPLEELMSTLDLENTNPAFVVLDSLHDPHNVGAIIRSAVAFGASAIIMGEYEQVQITGTVIKSSAGTSFAIPIVRVSNINATIIKLKEKGFWAYGLTGDGDTTLTTAKFDSKTLLVVGSEGDGIHKKTLEHCDFKLSIKVSPLCESLNASNAVAVSLYEWSRQQK